MQQTHFKIILISLYLALSQTVVAYVNSAQQVKTVDAVCGKIQVQCFTAPCPPITETFSSLGELRKNTLAEFVHTGSCDSRSDTMLTDKERAKLRAKIVFWVQDHDISTLVRTYTSLDIRAQNLLVLSRNYTKKENILITTKTFIGEKLSERLFPSLDTTIRGHNPGFTLKNISTIEADISGKYIYIMADITNKMETKQLQIRYDGYIFEFPAS